VGSLEIGNSTTSGAVFNFANSMVGAGAIGTGGAMAASGGAVSVVAIIVFGYLAKISSDLVISLSVQAAEIDNFSNQTNKHPKTWPMEQNCPKQVQRPLTFEELGEMTHGVLGMAAVALAKFGFAFGCCVAYVHLVKSNCASAIHHLLFEDSQPVPQHLVWLELLMKKDGLFAIFLSTVVILPLCLRRDLSVLAKASEVKMACMYAIVFVIVYMFFFLEINSESISSPSNDQNLTYTRWIQVRPGLIQSLGTFLFTFVAHHTVNITYESLKPEIQTVTTWKFVSASATAIGVMIVLMAGCFAYCTFWLDTSSDLFDIYPPLPIVDVAKVLLCLAMLLTYPMPFFACRDVLITSFLVTRVSRSIDVNGPLDGSSESSALIEEGVGSSRSENENFWMLPNEKRQLKFPYHFAISTTLWAVTVILAVMAPSLGTVLNVVGCTSGSVIGFILPSLFSFKLNGYSHLALFLMIIGGFVGLVGTYFSLSKI